MSGSVGPEQTPKKVQEQQLNRACEACRLSKVRCLVNPSSGSSQCQRCAKAGKTCIFAPPAKRRQRKRTDVRVAELEKEVKQMRSLLRTNQISPSEASEHESMDEDSPEPEMHADTEKTQSSTYSKSNESNETPPTLSFPDKFPDEKFSDSLCPQPPKGDCSMPNDSLGASDIDIVDRGLITMELAEEFLEIYRKDLVEDCPGVVIPCDWTASQLRCKKPALFHAVMAAAAHCKGAALSNRLHEEIIYLYARSLFIKGEKSVQYVQALLVTVSYYTPPNSPAQLMIYQYGNMAASMALELGLATKPRTHEQLPKRAIRALQRISSAEELLENCRTIIVLYAWTAGFAMRLRRPTILQFNSWMEEALTLLQKSPLVDDRRVVAWVKLQRIADEANTAFGFDDASTSFSLSELRLQVILRYFERRMREWKASIPDDIMSMALTMEYHQNIISMWEFAMDGGRYDAPDFRNRHLTLPALDDDCVQPETLLSRSALQINATIQCVSAAHTLLDCFVQLPTDKLMKASNVIFVRAIYALVALMKADYAVGTDAEGMGLVLVSQDLNVDYYLNTVIRMISDAVGPQKCRVPSHWLFVLKQKLKSWHDEHMAWRKAGGHLKRRKTLQKRDQDAAASAAAAPSSSLADDKPNTIGQPRPRPFADLDANPLTAPTPTPPLAPFTIPASYPGWHSSSTPTNAGGIPLSNAAAASEAAGLNMQQQPPPPPPPPGSDQVAFTPDMAAFSAAFQNGDLYLWNDINDNFGGWIPPGGTLYSDMQFGGGVNQGM